MMAAFTVPTNPQQHTRRHAGQQSAQQQEHTAQAGQTRVSSSMPSVASSSQQSLVPLTWAVSAYVGNGLVGVRVQSEEGGIGVLHVLVDNVKLGAGHKRSPNGYFRFTVADTTKSTAAAPALRVKMRTSIYNSVLRGEVTRDDGTDHLVSNFTIFVLADLDLPVVVLQCDYYDDEGGVDGVTAGDTNGDNETDNNDDRPKRQSNSSGGIGLEWIAVGHNDFDWNMTRSSPSLSSSSPSSSAQSSSFVAFASVQAPGERLNATQVITLAATEPVPSLLARSTVWWDAYWPQSFVALPSVVTRVEGFYYAQMHRFPASDRVVLHGLMGAFGPTDNYNLWPDDVWDMNEQVMYWISAASNRPEISAPLSRWAEGQGASSNTAGGLWMVHNYVKQMRFEGNISGLVGVALPLIASMVQAIAGGSEGSPGSLKLVNGTYHIEHCSSPEYRCYPPFQDRACTPDTDCNYALSQLRWGLRTVLSLSKLASSVSAGDA